MVNKKSNLVKTSYNKQPKIIVKDIPLHEKYYRTTEIRLKNKEKYYIIWHNEEDFRYGFSRLKRHESTSFKNSDIISTNTKTHRYRTTAFVAKGFKP